MKIILTLAMTGFAFLVLSAHAEDESYYIDASRKFIAKHKTADSEEKWEKYWKDRLKTAEVDREEDEERFIDRFIFDWMSSKAKKFAKSGLSVEDKLTACRLYLNYKNRNWDGSVRRQDGHQYKLPDSILAHLTNENLDKFISDDPALLQKTVDNAVGKIQLE